MKCLSGRKAGGAPPDLLAGLGEGKGIRRERNWKKKEGKGAEREGNGRTGEEEGEKRGRGERKGDGPEQVSREIDAPWSVCLFVAFAYTCRLMLVTVAVQQHALSWYQQSLARRICGICKI